MAAEPVASRGRARQYRRGDRPRAAYRSPDVDRAQLPQVQRRPRLQPGTALSRALRLPGRAPSDWRADAGPRALVSALRPLISQGRPNVIVPLHDPITYLVRM